jgi:hypothetical protein
MEQKLVTEIIRGNLEKAQLEYDSIDIREEVELRQGYQSVFHIRINFGGYQRSLGFWKIDTIEGKILGIARSISPGDKFVTLEQYAGRLSEIRVEAKVEMLHYSPFAHFVNAFSAAMVDSGIKLLCPKNYLRTAIRASVQKLYGKPSGLGFDEGAEQEMKSVIHKIAQSFSEDEMHEASQTIRDLSELCANVRQGNTIEKADVTDAATFYYAILMTLRKKFDNIDFNWAPETMESSLFSAFSNWIPFARLQQQYKKPEILASLLIDYARLKYVIDKLRSEIDTRAKEFLERLNNEFGSS